MIEIKEEEEEDEGEANRHLGEKADSSEDPKLLTSPGKEVEDDEDEDDGQDERALQVGRNRSLQPRSSQKQHYNCGSTAQ